MNNNGRTSTLLLLRGLAVAGLAYDAYVHIHLAGSYDAIGNTISQGWLFRVEAAAAALAAVVLVLSDRRRVWVVVGAVALGGLAAVMLYRYVNIPPIGPIPRMYEPVWYGDKARSAVAEGGVAVAWLIREAVRQRARGTAAHGTHAGPALLPHL